LRCNDSRYQVPLDVAEVALVRTPPFDVLTVADLTRYSAFPSFDRA
jgi:hypothetical protein